MKKILTILFFLALSLSSFAQLQDVNARYISGSTLKAAIAHYANGHIIFVNPVNGRMYASDTIPTWIKISPSALNAWSLTGNLGINQLINFIGTTDTSALIFKVNDSLSGKLDAVHRNAFYGFKSGYSNIGLNVFGRNNAYSGAFSGYSNVSGVDNFAGGAYSLYSNDGGNLNTAAGFGSLYYATRPYSHIAIGAFSGYYYNGQDGRLFVNSLDRGSLVKDSTESIIFGIQNQDTLLQHLFFNANTHTHTETVGANSRLGTELLRVYNGSVLFDGTIGDVPVNGAGSRFMWVSAKAALRAGVVDANQWDNDSIGNGSVAIGGNNIANGNTSACFNWRTLASGDYSFACGDSSIAAGKSSFAGGRGKAYGAYSFAWGDSTNVKGTNSVGIGYSNKINGNNCFAIGYNNNVYNVAGACTFTAGIRNTTQDVAGYNALNIGYANSTEGGFNFGCVNTTSRNMMAIGWYNTIPYGHANSIALGNGNTATGTGIGSIIAGNQSQVSTSFAYTLGYKCNTSGTKAISIGDSSQAIGASSFAANRGKTYGPFSVAIGDSCRTSTAGSYGVAMGYGNKVTSSYSVAFNQNTTAQSYNSAVFGRYNVISGTPGSWVANDPLFQIGNGDAEVSSNDAFRILKNGTTYIGDASSATDPILTVSTTDSITKIIGDVEVTGDITIEGYTSMKAAVYHSANTIDTSPYYVMPYDYTVMMNTTNGEVVLPAANSYNRRVIVIKEIKGSTVTVTADTGNIDGNGSITINALGSVMVQSDGTDWWIIAKN